MHAEENLRIRICGAAHLPTLVYLPGIHGDWTLISSFRSVLQGKVRFVEFTYPRTLEWSIHQYAAAAEEALLQQGIEKAWILGESFGSQVGWAFLERIHRQKSFEVQGYILANGFVRYPFLPGVRLAGWLFGALPAWSGKFALAIYRHYSRFRHRHAPETLECIDEFIARRNRLDVEAMRHRLRLIETYDCCGTSSRVNVPVFFLAGVIDPIVPWPISRRWLRRNCPGYAGSATILLADHNVLSTQPVRSAEIVLRWMGR